jgi:hypothetical protein
MNTPLPSSGEMDTAMIQEIWDDVAFYHQIAYSVGACLTKYNHTIYYDDEGNETGNRMDAEFEKLINVTLAFANYFKLGL